MGTSDSNFEAEPYQLANYGTGGHYLPHHDYLYDVYEDSDETDDFSRFPSYGDRLATLMIYMSDVEEGGATVFPKLGVRLTPKKGDAAFWWNLKTSGAVEKLTLHAGCPVLYGNKWTHDATTATFSTPTQQQMQQQLQLQMQKQQQLQMPLAQHEKGTDTPVQ
ncbi:hypothetical protein ISCGN_024390 [Ixodes scapularis]